MTFECSQCGKEKKFPFSKGGTVCIKCTLDNNFEHVGTYSNGIITQTKEGIDIE